MLWGEWASLSLWCPSSDENTIREGCTWKGIIGSLVHMGLVCASVLCSFCSRVNARRAWASTTPGTATFMSKHHIGLWSVEVWWAYSLILPNRFSCGCFLSHCQTQKISHCGCYFALLFFSYPNLEYTDLSNRSLPRLRPESLESTDSLVANQLLLHYLSLHFWLLGLLFCLMKLL